MEAFPKIEYQRQLIVASLDDFTPNATFPNYYGGQFGTTSSIWRRAVAEFLCANLKCGLIESTNRPEFSTVRGAESLRELLLGRGKESGESTDILWNSLYFSGTRILIDMITRFGLHNWDSLAADEPKDLCAVLSAIYNKI